MPFNNYMCTYSYEYDTQIKLYSLPLLKHSLPTTTIEVLPTTCCLVPALSRHSTSVPFSKRLASAEAVEFNVSSYCPLILWNTKGPQVWFLDVKWSIEMLTQESKSLNVQRVTPTAVLLWLHVIENCQPLHTYKFPSMLAGLDVNESECDKYIFIIAEQLANAKCSTTHLS